MNMKNGFPLTVVILVVAVLMGSTSLAADTVIDCDVVHGFNFSPSETATVGHLTYLKLGSKELDSDLDITNPEDPAGDKLKVTGVMDDIYWDNTVIGAVQFTARLSTLNRDTVAALTHTVTSGTRVLLQFNVYDYDVGEGKYFKAFHTNSVTVAGYIESQGGDLQITIDHDQAADVVSPVNFPFQLNVAADDIAVHDLHLAGSVSDKLAKQWGIASSPVPDISTSMTTMDFGTVGAGQTPSQVLTVYNDGTADLDIGIAGQANPLEAPYLITADTCSSQALSPGDSCAITVAFNEPVVSAAVLFPTAGGLGLLACGLVFAGSRHRQVLVLLLAMTLSAAALVSCGGSSSEAVQYTGDFDIPCNDPDSPTMTIEVVGER
jgi:hypothetical protein